jgi:hypothetical protein
MLGDFEIDIVKHVQRLAVGRREPLAHGVDRDRIPLRNGRRNVQRA